jgi:hypothetical protein
MSLLRKASLMAIVGMFASTAASAAPGTCLSPDQQSAFDVGSLKSALSVLAVACSAEDNYNAFVEMHRRELVAEDGTVNAWFKRQYGKAAQARYDSYITLLANEQSEIGQKQGSDYCPRLKLIFPEVMAVPSAALPQYAAAKDLMPDDLSPCVSQVRAVEPAGKGSRSSTRHTTTHKK